MKSEPGLLHSIDDLAKGDGAGDVGRLPKPTRSGTTFATRWPTATKRSSTTPASTPRASSASWRSWATPIPTQPSSTPAANTSTPRALRDSPRWVIRNVRLLDKYKRMVPLSELRTIPGLAEMFVLRKGQRLSVMPVTADEFKIIDSLPGLR